MKNRVLIAVDESGHAAKAVKYAAATLDKDSQVTLFHIFEFAEPDTKGLEKEEILAHHLAAFKERMQEYKTFIERKRASAEQMMGKNKDILVKAGFDPSNIELKIEVQKDGVARDILRELNAREYDTVAVGRRGLSGAKGFFSGSVSNRIVHHAKNCAVWVIE